MTDSNTPLPAGPAQSDHEQRLAAGSACLEAALQVYLPHGFSVTCCCDPDHVGVYKKHGKECHHPGKAPMHEWTVRQKKLPTPAEVETYWHDYPIGNVGCVLGQVSGLIRVDVDGAPGEAALQEWSQGDVPDTWEFRSSAAGRGLLYRWPQDQPCHTVAKDSPDGKHTELRLMGNGSQTVLPPSRHESGSIYTWVPGRSPDDLPLALAPPWLVARMTVVPRPERPDSTPLGAPTRDYATALLRWVPNPGADRDTWREVGMALHSTGAAWAFDLWDTWSQQYPEKYSASDQVKIWKSFSLAGPAGKAPITFGTLVHRAREGGYQRGPARPTIRITTQVAEVVNEAIAALQGMPQAPLVYQRARQLCIIGRGGAPLKWLRRQADTPLIQIASAAHLWELMTTAAQWAKYDARSEEWKKATPPHWVVDVIQGRSSWPFPLLEGVICSPTLRPDGSVLDTPGYDAYTGLYLDFNGTTFPALRAHPTMDDARSALGRLQEVFADFPFAAREPGELTNPFFSAALAAVLTLVGRPAIEGNVPLFGVTATASGTGKGKLVDAVALIGTGRIAPKMGQTLDESEELKRLLALALEGASVCCIDNVAHPLGNQHLDLALTSQTIHGRILGQTGMAEAPWQAVMFATGNNLSYRGDMVRRVVPIALDPQMERPEERTDFRHPRLEEWVRSERPRLVVAALTILRAYFVAGCPAQELTPYGSFEGWSGLVRHALVWLGEADPCAGRKDLAAQTDENYERLAALLGAWEKCYPTTPAVTINRIQQDIAFHASHNAQTPGEWNELHAALIPFDKKFDGKSLSTHRIGNALRPIEGRVIDHKRLKRHGKDGHQTRWRLETV